MQGHGVVAVSTLDNGLEMLQHIIALHDEACKHPWLNYMSYTSTLHLVKFGSDQLNDKLKEQVGYNQAGEAIGTC